MLCLTCSLQIPPLPCVNSLLILLLDSGGLVCFCANKVYYASAFSFMTFNLSVMVRKAFTKAPILSVTNIFCYLLNGFSPPPLNLCPYRIHTDFRNEVEIWHFWVLLVIVFSLSLAPMGQPLTVVWGGVSPSTTLAWPRSDQSDDSVSLVTAIGPGKGMWYRSGQSECLPGTFFYPHD